MKILLFLLMLIRLYGNDFEASTTCQGCHPAIYEEYKSSMHANAALQKDPVHKAVWDKHPAKEAGEYKCAKCHMPSEKEKALPLANAEGVSCVSCHKIESITKHQKSNVNNYNTDMRTFFSYKEGADKEHEMQYKKQSSFFGLMTTKSGSPFHKINFSNPDFHDGKMCMGCHSHKQNDKAVDMCRIDDINETADKNNCITCHMPTVLGSFTTAKDSKTHRSHDFAGSIHKSNMLAQYVNITLEKDANGFNIVLENMANHDLLLHPLRLGEMRVSVQSKEKKEHMQTVYFKKILAQGETPAMPWNADNIKENSQLKAYEKRKVKYPFALKKDDVVRVVFGHYQVNPKAIATLGRSEDSAAFRVLKDISFNVGENEL